MQIITAILALIKALPTILSIIKEIFKFFHELKDHFERKDRAEKLKDAIVDARTKGDTTKLEALFKGKNEAPPAA